MVQHAQRKHFEVDLFAAFKGEKFPDLRHVPEPARYYLIIRQLGIKEKIGSVILPDSARDAQSYTHGVGVVLKVGPLEFGPIAMLVQEGGKKWVYGRISGAAGIKNMMVLWKAKEAKFETHIDSAALGDIGSWGNPVTIGFALGACSGSQAVLMVQHKDKWIFNK